MESLHIDSVLKKIDNKVILNDVAFSINVGQVLGIFGRNGSGKTTLFKCILNLEKPDFIYRKFGNAFLLKKRIPSLFSYSSQEIFLPDNFKVIHLLRFFELDKNKIIASEDVIINNLNLKVKELSYGQRFYIQLLLVIFSKKKICVLDEPFSGLAPNLIYKISNYIKLNSDKIFIVTDHNYESLFEISSKRMFLKNGNLLDVSHLDILQLRNLYYI